MLTLVLIKGPSDQDVESRAGRGTVTDPFGIGPLLYRKFWFGPFGTKKSSNICGSEIFGIPNISVGCGAV